MKISFHITMNFIYELDIATTILYNYYQFGTFCTIIFKNGRTGEADRQEYEVTKQ